MKVNNELLNKVLLTSKIDKIKSKCIKNWLTDFMTVKNVLGRLATIVFGSIFFCVIYFVLRQKGLDGAYGIVQFNHGSAFGSGSDWAPWAIYLTKSLVALMFLISFLIFNKWYCYVSLWFVFINALCIIIDKSLVIPDQYANLYRHNPSLKYDSVVDYFHFKTFVNNIGDIFIITFACTSVLSITVYLIRSEWFRDSDKATTNEVAHV